MFPEYRDLITKLKTEGTNHRFLRLFEQHNELDHKASALEAKDAGSLHTELEMLKKEKLHIKDQLYAILREEAAKQ